MCMCVCVFSFLINLLTASLIPRESEVTLFFTIELDMLASNQRMRFIKPLLHFVSHISLLIRPSIVPASIFNEMRSLTCHLFLSLCSHIAILNHYA